MASKVHRFAFVEAIFALILMGILSHIGPDAVQAFHGVAVTSRTSLGGLPLLQYRRGNDDDSEWYSPPPVIPEASSPLTRPPLGLKPLQTDITTVEQLDAILDDETDHRLVVVKFYASWYVHWFRHHGSPLN
jgi:hypothetical protein